ncbi:hypothetical protein GH733_013274 [Mirounga leonina]|nr:hypothetical protein GH733_013274 [Mirounga leonina]
MRRAGLGKKRAEVRSSGVPEPAVLGAGTRKEIGLVLRHWNLGQKAGCMEGSLEAEPSEGAPPGNYGNYGYANSGYSACEEENERLTESLRSKVTAIKSLSIEIGHEVKHQNKLLAEMDSQFDSTTGFLGKTMGKLKILSRGSQTKLLCYMMLFSLFVFFVIYWIIKLSN